MARQETPVCLVLRPLPAGGRKSGRTVPRMRREAPGDSGPAAGSAAGYETLTKPLTKPAGPRLTRVTSHPACAPCRPSAVTAPRCDVIGAWVGDDVIVHAQSQSCRPSPPCPSATESGWPCEPRPDRSAAHRPHPPVSEGGGAGGATPGRVLPSSRPGVTGRARSCPNLTPNVPGRARPRSRRTRPVTSARRRAAIGGRCPRRRALPAEPGPRS